jgi:hypothetical protein
MKFYKIFLFFVIFGKIIYILSELNLKLNIEKNLDSKEEIKKYRKQNHIIYIMSDTLMSLLLIYLFIPLSYGGVQLGFGERISLFTLGVINLMQFEWLEPFEYFKF